MARILDPVMTDLREQVLRMGSLAETILAKALRAAWERNSALAREVAIDDLEIDRLDLAIDEGVLRALALQAPVADDLRQVIAIKMMATDLERVGDLARNIARSALRLSERAPVSLPSALVRLGEGAQRILRDALDAYGESDSSRARAVLAADDRIDEVQDRVVEQAIREIGSHPESSAQEVDLILIAENLERVGDHATNIAEDVILAEEARNLKHAGKLGGSQTTS
ncbi:MAG: phosphate signaling complex protein PhoU [Myxococcota bacterium]